MNEMETDSFLWFLVLLPLGMAAVMLLIGLGLVLLPFVAALEVYKWLNPASILNN